MHTSILNGLGPALRWLRDRRGRKQYQVAEAAGITKGMLSAYETGRQRPSLETLDKLLETLKCDLSDLHGALQIVNGRPVGPSRTPGWALAVPGSTGSAAGAAGSGGPLGESMVDVYAALDLTEPLPPQEEQALAEMLQGFHRLLRFLHAGRSPSRDGEYAPELPTVGEPPGGESQ